MQAAGGSGSRFASNQPLQQFQHKLNSDMRRDDAGILLVESTCMRCGVSRTVSLRDGSLEKWELAHTCGNLRLIHPRSGNF